MNAHGPPTVSRNFVSISLSTLIVLALSGDASADRRRPVRRPGASSWDATLRVEQVAGTVVAGRTLYSSTRLLARWSAPSFPVDHFVLTASESGGSTIAASAAASATSGEIGSLESGTGYGITIAACLDAACSSRVAGGGASGETPLEAWQIRGSGNSYNGATKIVSDGNTKPWALRWGSGAGAALEGMAQLWYDPIAGSEKGVKIGTLLSPVTSSADSVASFSPLSGFGFLRQDSQPNVLRGPSTFQAVPLTESAGGKIRFFWETTAADGRGRVYSLDSQDGWLGRDFHPGSATQCSQSDVASGAACAPALLIGIESDDPVRYRKLREARQLKVGYPMLDDWRWDASPGSFMIVTAHLTDSVCSSTFFNAAYAVWDGTRWNLQYGDDGCPRLITGVQAPTPLHLGGVRYKLYFNANRSTGGAPSEKPLKLLYADGALTGDPRLVEFDDWETIDRARSITVLWPTGTELTDAEESSFDDFCVWMPTLDPAFQVIYSNMSCPGGTCGPPFIGMAVLLNP